jgi:hypothetical protein
MNHSYKYTTKEQSKQLKELGLLQISDWYYNEDLPDLLHWLFAPEIPESGYAAYDATDIGIMLPRKIRINKADYTFRINLEKSGIWHLKYRTRNQQLKLIPLCTCYDRNEVIGRCTMLTMLIMAGYISVKEINERFKNFYTHEHI